MLAEGFKEEENVTRQAYSSHIPFTASCRKEQCCSAAPTSLQIRPEPSVPLWGGAHFTAGTLSMLWFASVCKIPVGCVYVTAGKYHHIL